MLLFSLQATQSNNYGGAFLQKKLTAKRYFPSYVELFVSFILSCIFYFVTKMKSCCWIMENDLCQIFCAWFLNFYQTERVWIVWNLYISSHGEVRNIKFGHQINIIERVPLGTLPQVVVMPLAHNHLTNHFISSYRGAAIIKFGQ